MHLIRSVSLWKMLISFVYTIQGSAICMLNEIVPIFGREPVFAVKNDESQENAFAHTIDVRPYTYNVYRCDWCVGNGAGSIQNMYIDFCCWWKNYSKATFISISNVIYTRSRARTYPPTHTRTRNPHTSKHNPTTSKNACKRKLSSIIWSILICRSCHQNIDVYKGCLRGNM